MPVCGFVYDTVRLFCFPDLVISASIIIILYLLYENEGNFMHEIFQAINTMCRFHVKLAEYTKHPFFVVVVR